MHTMLTYSGVYKPPRPLPLQVVSTHPYQGEDEDELTFEKGVVISVIPYDDPDDEVGQPAVMRIQYLY